MSFTLQQLPIAWVPNVRFKAGQLVVTPEGELVKSLAAHYTGATFDASQYEVYEDTDEYGLLADMPADGSRPDDSTYFATDQFGGTLYRMVAGVWQQAAPGKDQASTIIAGPAQMLGGQNFDVKAVGATVTDIPGMAINVPASNRPVLLRHKWEVQCNTGTAVNASAVRVVCYITDDSNVIVASGGLTAIQVGATAIVIQGQINLEKYLPAPVAGGTYKLRAQLAAAAPLNWTSVLLFPANGNGGNNSEDNFYALAV